MTTPSTTTCSRGDVVLVPFQFADSFETKRRPALVISSRSYHTRRQDVIVAAITSRIRRPLLFGDSLIAQWQASGLPKPSVATAVVRTIKRDMIARRLGALRDEDMRVVDSSLARALGIAFRPVDRG